MGNIHINTDVLKNLYAFIADYYSDPALASYIFNAFSIDKDNIPSAEVPYEKFYKILHYLQKMSGDQQICFNAGRYYSEARILKNISAPGLRFSVKNTFWKTDILLARIFPAFEISIKEKNANSINLLLCSDGKTAKPNYFFTEYIRGIIAQIPKNWNLPLTDVKIDSYSFSLEEVLNDIDIPFRKNESSYFIYDQEIAKEERSAEDPHEAVQIIKSELYIKDVFIPRHVKLNSKHISLTIKWHNSNILPRFIFNLLTIAALPLFVAIYLYFPESLYLNTAGFIIYELLLLLIRAFYKNINLIKIFKESEANLLDELYIQRSTTSEAIQDTARRLQSIENVIEITKEIIYEKNIVNLFENIRKLSAKALNADRTTVFIHDKENKELRSGPELSDEKQEFRIPEDKGIVGEVFKLKKIVNVKDAYNNPNFSKAIDRQTGYETKTILSAPLLDLEKNFLGVIQVLNKNDGVFEKIDEHIIETLSSYIASALKDTLTISSLQKRGIDPDMLNGLGSVTRHINNEYSAIQQAVLEIDSPELTPAKSRMNKMSLLLGKLAFLFDEQYKANFTEAGIDSVLETIGLFVKINNDNASITYERTCSLSQTSLLIIDDDIFNKAVSEIIRNSIESITEEGKISLKAYNYVAIPKEIIHDLSIEKIIEEYNVYSEENAAGFIKFVTSRKPFLESELEKIKNNINEFAVFEIFDTGSAIPSGIKEKIFHSFFSTKNRFGLGLAIAKKAASLLNGLH